jgi:hypothetical protein
VGSPNVHRLLVGVQERRILGAGDPMRGSGLSDAPRFCSGPEATTSDRRYPAARVNQPRFPRPLQKPSGEPQPTEKARDRVTIARR